MAQDAWRFLGKKGRIDAISKHLESLQVDTAEVHYRPRASRDQSTWQHHSLESRAFLAILLYMCKSKASKTKTKQCAWKLLIGMVKLAFDSLGQAQRFTGVVYGQDGTMKSSELEFSALQTCSNWQALLESSPGACHVWDQLRRKCWHGFCITTTLDQASLADIWHFLVYLHAKPGAGPWDRICMQQWASSFCQH